MVRAVAGVDGGHTDGVGVPPVHAGLLAAAYDQDAHGRLDMARADVVAVLPEPAVAHVVLALLKVQQIGQRFRRGVQLGLVKPPNAFGSAFRTGPVEQSPAEAVFL